MDTRVSRIEQKLTQELNPLELKVTDFTDEHRGHAGQDSSDETHIRIAVKSQAFEDLTLLESHRRINALLSNEFSSGLHALEIQILK
ncbi:BolA family protein [Leptospira sp. GIMC2001]|uniref:BolA family protein n=1 Tax=Leptospira sp. GIMC2001 TaxID=1513297 RepID=UPI00234A43BA|nr:BolA family protein [Leptospira sp. GIMC2001]WCL51143.1 BolA family transcriptional regulator [Leptospira sp. GIMC2001]